jgi:hypothetical protein
LAGRVAQLGPLQLHAPAECCPAGDGPAGALSPQQSRQSTGTFSRPITRHSYGEKLTEGDPMRLLRPTTEDDMIAVYLKAEIVSERFGHLIVTQLERDGGSRTLVDTPDITNLAENAYRRQLLGNYRAYVFEELPAHIAWYRALLTREEVAKVRYIDYDYWNELSSHTRLPLAATEAIHAGREIYGQSTEVFLRVAQALREGAHFPELIIVGASPNADLTVYEGHGRLTAYMLAPECLPDELEVIAGFAPECAQI